MSDVLIGAVALLPVLTFLALLRLLDSFKLVALRRALFSVAIGCAIALICFAVNRGVLQWTEISAELYRRYGGPLFEELLKAIYLWILIRRARIGFLVDAAIHGFAIGAGFAVIENVYYMVALDDPNLWLWIVRGLGTAIMHGCTTAIFGLLAKGMSDRHDSQRWPLALPALLTAFGIHAAYNHFFLPPLANTAVLLVGFPLLVVVIFERSEHATREWLGTGFDTDAQLLEQLLSGQIRDTRVGRYLESLRSSFPGTVVGDLLSLMQIQLELSMRAKGILMAREMGLDVPIGEDVRPKLEELNYLERTVGPTGRLALHPVLRTSRRDLWQLYVLGK